MAPSDDRSPDRDGLAGEEPTRRRPPAPAPGDPSPDPDAPEPSPEAAPDEEQEAEEALQQDVEELVAKASERDEYLSLAQRTQADFENYRKRAAKDIASAESRGVGKLARELLPAIDNLELALNAAETNGSDADQLVDGIKLVRQQLLAALARVGIEPYSPLGERFDPNEHEAVAQRAVEDCEPGTVAEVFQTGYRANGSVLRPARVVVAE